MGLCFTLWWEAVSGPTVALAGRLPQCCVHRPLGWNPDSCQTSAAAQDRNLRQSGALGPFAHAALATRCLLYVLIYICEQHGAGRVWAWS